MIFFRSLKTKFGFAITSLLILIFLAQALLEISQTQKRLIEDVNREAKSFAQLSTKPLLDAYQLYYLSGFQKFKEIVQDIQRLSPNIKQIRLVDMEGRVLFDTNDLRLKKPEELGKIDIFLLEEARKPTPSFLQKNERSDRLSEIVYPFLDEWGRHQHSLIYSVSYQAVAKENSLAVMRTISSALILFILSLFLVSLLTNKITKPLLELEKGARIVGRGDLNYQLRINTGDEIERLADEFNIMTVRLRALIGALQEAKGTLELRVKERTRELEEEKNKTLAIITNFADGVIVFDRDNKVTLINPKVQELFKIEPKEVVGKSLFELNDIPNFRSLANLLGREIKKIFREELSLSENMVLEVTTLPLIREKEILGNLVVLHDITREKLIERMKTEFVSLTAHQLRTPLSAIKWTIRMLLDGDLGKITQEQKSFLEKTYNSNEKMISLINDLLNVTRIEEGRYIYKPVPTDFLKVIQEVIHSRESLIKERDVSFEFKKPKEKFPEILMDAEKIKLVVENLLDNAIKYTRPKGKVTISLNKGIKDIEFKIQDTGIGIPKDQQERVFTKFFRGANVMRLETEGTGLGLFISKNIIEAHGGRIWFDSEEGRGTIFYFNLPIKKNNNQKKS